MRSRRSRKLKHIDGMCAVSECPTASVRSVKDRRGFSALSAENQKNLRGIFPAVRGGCLREYNQKHRIENTAY